MTTSSENVLSLPVLPLRNTARATRVRVCVLDCCMRSDMSNPKSEEVIHCLILRLPAWVT